MRLFAYRLSPYTIVYLRWTEYNTLALAQNTERIWSTRTIIKF